MFRLGGMTFGTVCKSIGAGEWIGRREFEACISAVVARSLFPWVPCNRLIVDVQRVQCEPRERNRRQRRWWNFALLDTYFTTGTLRQP